VDVVEGHRSRAVWISSPKFRSCFYFPQPALEQRFVPFALAKDVLCMPQQRFPAWSQRVLRRHDHTLPLHNVIGFPIVKFILQPTATSSFSSGVTVRYPVSYSR
jgi:hypothetical protein